MIYYGFLCVTTAIHKDVICITSTPRLWYPSGAEAVPNGIRRHKKKIVLPKTVFCTNDGEYLGFCRAWKAVDNVVS